MKSPSRLQLIEKFYRITLPHKSNGRILSHYIYDMYFYDNLIEKFSNWYYKEFNLDEYSVANNVKFFPTTSKLLSRVRDALNNIGQQLFTSYYSNMVNRNFQDYIHKGDKDRKFIYSDSFNYYYNKLLNVKYYNLYKFVSYIRHLCYQIEEAILKSVNLLNTDRIEVNNINNLRIKVLKCIMKCEELSEKNYISIGYTMKKIRNNIFENDKYKNLSDEEKERESNTANLLLDRFEETIIKDKDEFIVNIKEICQFILQNFRKINPNIIEEIIEFFNYILKTLMSDIIGGDYAYYD